MHRPRSTYWSFGTTSYLVDTLTLKASEAAGSMPDAWKISREQFDAFLASVQPAARHRLHLHDIDCVAGYSRSTREDLESGKGNPKSHAAYTRVLQMDPATFLAELAAKH